MALERFVATALDALHEGKFRDDDPAPARWLAVKGQDAAGVLERLILDARKRLDDLGWPGNRDVCYGQLAAFTQALDLLTDVKGGTERG